MEVVRESPSACEDRLSDPFQDRVLSRSTKSRIRDKADDYTSAMVPEQSGCPLVDRAWIG
jgi:hypothetical protein